jgi:L-fuconolactonase
MLRVIAAVMLWTLLSLSLLAQENAAIPIIDCHVHLWDLQRSEGVAWIKPENKKLYRNFLPQDHEPIAAANNVRGVIVVQAGQSLPDNQWNLDITAHNKCLYRGVVGNLSKIIGTPEFKRSLDKLCEDPRYLGYRLSGRPAGKFTEAFFQDLEYTAERGKTVDILLGEFHLDDVAEIAKRLPKLRLIVNHFGGVILDGKPLDPKWIESFRAVALHKNVYCKVSALFGRFREQPAPTEERFYKPVMDLAWECFGEDRLIYGSDWPVSEQTAGYSAIVPLTRSYFDSKGRVAAEKLFNKNAISFYKIPTLVE